MRVNKWHLPKLPDGHGEPPVQSRAACQLPAAAQPASRPWHTPPASLCEQGVVNKGSKESCEPCKDKNWWALPRDRLWIAQLHLDEGGSQAAPTLFAPRSTLQHHVQR